ncbi:DUF1553 domain-containing protein [bacterium]|nr:DUF1553 domain-containing protein [bacterium]
MFISCLLAARVSRLSAAESISFNHQIRPILSDRCFNCHGPDQKARKAKMRLDTLEGSRKKLDGGWQVIKPGDVNHSELVRRIFTTDPDDMMPPPDSNLKLSEAERELLKTWIAQGAEYQGHWAFIPVPEKVAVPASDFSNPIDAFVARRLARENLKLAPEASRETLIRRLSLDLIGLPPTPDETKAFVNDLRPDAYEQLVDRLLASPHYGEQRAVDWLDLARYADTYGYQADVERDMSPWRDWVIRAFNENLPYDQFLIWQIAGDLLPHATRDQILATAFNRLHRQTNEGGSIEEEFRVAYVNDRVQTFGTAMLGLTLQCSSCHDHKFDPIKQSEYYSLSAFFNNIDESGLYSHFTHATPNPTMLLYRSDKEKQRHADLKLQIAEIEKKLKSTAANSDRESQSNIEELMTGKMPVPPLAAFAFDELKDGKSPNQYSTNAAEFVDSPKLVPGHDGQAVQFTGDNEVVCKKIAHFNRTDEFTISLWLKRTEDQDRAVVLHHSRAWTDSGSRGYELVLENGKPFFGIIHFWPGNAIAIRGADPLPLNKWVHVALTYDGSSHAAGMAIYINGQPAKTEVVRDHLFKDILHRSEWGDFEVGNINLTLGGRFRDSGFRNGLIDDLKIFDRDLSQLSAEEDSTTGPMLAELHKLRQEENNLVNDIPEIMVMKEMPVRRKTYLLKRGAYDAHGEEVQPDTPAAIFPFDPKLPRNRLGLAKWLTDRKNPLTARVAVNRVWKQDFGRGIVATPEDFGSQGAQPTHPALLDWLAGWFMDNGWDVKKLHKLIVTSRTYRQTSEVAPDIVARDPNNDWLARGPRHRLTAEQIRDEALAASDLLVPKIGGPSVKPYQPAGLWEESGTGKSYEQDKGTGLYRRSLYTFWRRTAPPPTMLTFDATSREVCTARRETTTTPLQSLVLMNDPQFLEASRVLATSTLAQQSESDTAIQTGFEKLIGRQPSARELKTLQSLFAAERTDFTGQADAAKKVLSIGETTEPDCAQPAEAAALTLVFNTIMNFDDFVMER